MKLSKGTRIALVIGLTASLLILAFALYYFSQLNRSEDPRVTRARECLARYDELSGNPESYRHFGLLDSADAIYSSLPDYAGSYERGVILNNKCSAILLMALYDSTVQEAEKHELLELSLDYCNRAIGYYTQWIAHWGSKDEKALYEGMELWMQPGDTSFGELNFQKVLDKRIKDLILAQTETPRRLSVSLSNKAIIYRHLEMPDSALSHYKQALELWPDNRTAKSNLSVMLGGEALKPGLIESLFPPKKD